MQVGEAIEVLVGACREDPKLEGPVIVQVTLAESPVESRQHHPILLPLPHKFRRKDETMTSLVVKDPSHKIVQDLNKDDKSAFLFDEVIGVGKLRRRIAKGRKNGKTTKAAEQFVKSFSLIFVHEKVREPLAECLGLGYYKRAKHLPIPVSFNSESTKSLEQLRFIVKAAMQSTQLILKPESKSCSIRVGHIKMDPQKLADNIEAAIKLCKQRIPKGLGGNSAYFIKTPDSLSLQIG